ncbi:shTK domain protein [Dictyocaulus viviparus]|uniref:ShTK domain protein n=1 Tax=Dictyocaulus viviparus TaxID=29172 RepID=A0A0D8XAQ3_DICVI|nr:shTK domain protein [Dictyocaulus viviparus]
MKQNIFILLLNILRIFCDGAPNIYRWMADNAYICGPTKDFDGSILLFLNEEQGRECRACDTKHEGVPYRACGIRITQKEIEPRVACYPKKNTTPLYDSFVCIIWNLNNSCFVPQICIDDYILRYSTAFMDQSNESQHANLTVGDKINFLDNVELNVLEKKIPKNVHPEITKLAQLDKKTLRKNDLNSENTINDGGKVFDPFISQQYDPDAFTVINVNTASEPTKRNEMHFQSAAVNKYVSNVSSGNSPISTTFSKNLHIQSLSQKTIYSLSNEHSQAPIPTSPSSSLNMDKSDKEFLLEEPKEDTRQILLQKRRNIHRFFGTTTIPTTTTLPPTTKTPRICQDKYKLCCFWAIAGECETNPFWMRIQCPKSCGTCDCSLREADKCISTGINCTIPTTTAAPVTETLQPYRPALRISTFTTKITTVFVIISFLG